MFAVGTDWVQLFWRHVPPGEHSIQLVPTGRSNVAPTAAAESRVLGDQDGRRPACVELGGLAPGERYDVVVNGRRTGGAHTLSPPAGRLLGRVATISDLHVGELAFGFLPRLRTQPKVGGNPADAHPMWCLTAAIDEIIAWQPDLLVVKGDLGHRNVPAEYDLVAPELLRTGLPLLVTVGNHDGGNHHRCDAVAELAARDVDIAGPVQVRDVEGARIVLADTVVDGAHGGTTDRHLEAVIAAVADHAGPCLVALHHQIMTTRLPYYLPVGIPKEEGRRFLDTLAAAQPRAFVTSGHTHRNRARRHGPLVVTEVGAPKDHPGVWATYELYEGGIVQTVRRIAERRALDWSERAGTTVGNLWGQWSPGRLAHRCIVQRWS